MDRKSKLLPTLQGGKSKSRLTKDKLKIEELLLKNSCNRKTHKDYRSEQDFTTIKANNFLSRVETIDSPQIIFAVTDQIKQAISNAKDKQNLNESWQFNKSTMSAFRNSHGFISPKSTFHKQSSALKADNKLIAQERQQALELARWLDQKISKLRVKHTVTFLDILQYKQNILNYALGKIIDSLSRRCKQQGQILSLVWQNTFNMFQSVFNVLVQANKNREKENISQAKQLHSIFQTNHNFLREQNTALKKENDEIFQKMKNVILWNKRLRRERKHLNTANRILQYRNTTYSQALQETLEMLLQSTPDPVLLQTAKKTILKLGKEKNRKKHYIKQQIDSQLNTSTRNIVYNWLKKNSYLDEQKLQLFKESCFSKEDGFIFSQLDDLNEINQVNIYDFFKLYDVGVQAVPPTSSNFSQCQKKTFRNVEMMTKNISTIECGCQTNPGRKDSQLSNESPSAKKHVEIHSSKPSSIFKNKKEKSKTPVKNREGKNIAQRQKDRQGINNSQRGQRGQIDLHRHFRKGSVNDFYLKQKLQNSPLNDKREEIASDNKISINKIEQEKLMSQKGDNTSMSQMLQEDTRTKGVVTTKNMMTYSQKGRQKSLADFNQPHYNGSSKMIKLNHIEGFKRKENQKRSMAYIKYDSPKTLERLAKKSFNEAYKDQKEIFQNNKMQFVDQIIRRRSFYTKRRVQFANFRQAEQESQKLRQYMRGTRYGTNNRTRIVDKANLLNYSVDRWTKKGPAPSNIAKSKALTSAKGVFESITASIQQIVRIPPKNKVFVNNSLSTLAKYISDLVVDYIKQIKREKEDIPTQGQKALYPLSVLLMERMTFKYGLKEIAQKKIKHFIQKVLTFSSISQKISLYSLLLGLEDRNVGTDELLAYLKCLVYFQEKKPGRDTSTQSNSANIELVRQHIRKILEYFFDSEYINLVELKLQIYFQQTSSYATVEGIALIIIHELLRRKKQLRLKYSKIHIICNRGANFFTNVFQLLRMASNYRDLALNFQIRKSVKKQKQIVDTLKQIRSRAAVKKHDKNEHKILAREYDITKISQALHQLLKRSDIMDEQYGKSITEERFITAAMLLNLPNVQDLETLLLFMRGQFEYIKAETSYFNSISCDDFKSLDKLAKIWNKSTIQGEGEPIWQFSKIYAEKVEEEVFGVMGKLGIIGTAIETYLFNFESV